ncbi:AraC family transcriptional regulator of adaptative response / methylphosphotriester-DNA alkyltransferase methyltransferase [Chitinophaga sp. W3I9]|uniref:helix-turn-helix domain-containing protein n=1 Tax=unclassified Chitinophaga TaxID=2619133 RepID=UPI003D1BDC64
MADIGTKRIKRSEEITSQYFTLLDKHLDDLVKGRATEMMELNEIAAELCVSHKHLTDTIRQTMGAHPCHFYDQKIIEKAKQLLQETNASIAHIAITLTYDPSNFSKFFKKYVKLTPDQWRKNNLPD